MAFKENGPGGCCCSDDPGNPGDPCSCDHADVGSLICTQQIIHRTPTPGDMPAASSGYWDFKGNLPLLTTANGKGQSSRIDTKAMSANGPGAWIVQHDNEIATVTTTLECDQVISGGVPKRLLTPARTAVMKPGALPFNPYWPSIQRGYLGIPCEIYAGEAFENNPYWKLTDVFGNGDRRPILITARTDRRYVAPCTFNAPFPRCSEAPQSGLCGPPLARFTFESFGETITGLAMAGVSWPFGGTGLTWNYYQALRRCLGYSPGAGWPANEQAQWLGAGGPLNSITSFGFSLGEDSSFAFQIYHQVYARHPTHSIAWVQYTQNLAGSGSGGWFDFANKTCPWLLPQPLTQVYNIRYAQPGIVTPAPFVGTGLLTVTFES